MSSGSGPRASSGSRCGGQDGPVGSLPGWLLAVACGLTLVVPAVAPTAGLVFGQEGFTRLSGRHIELITDLPVDDDLAELPEVFDAAVPQWCQLFGVPEASVQDWRVTAYLMLSRERFIAAGYLPANLPPFRHGYQVGHDLWVVEQPSAYYRRHLLLHEGTHWFMNRKYGNAGPPWLMEGMAEWLATHRWDGTQLTLGIVPVSRDDVPYWGRLAVIRQQLEDGVAPSLETILRYGPTAHVNVDAYAWSWAAVMFLREHPASREKFFKMLAGPLTQDEGQTRALLREFHSRRPLMRGEWTVMLTELDYGFDPARELVRLNHRKQPLDAEAAVTVAADRGWQATGWTVTAGQKIRVQARGRYVVGTEPEPWWCEPAGVTLRYHRGQPLGKLLLAVAPAEPQEPEFSTTLDIVAVGAEAEVTATVAGEILLRINEESLGLGDNSGTLTVTLQTR
jgi:hypothetical protein